MKDVQEQYADYDPDESDRLGGVFQGSEGSRKRSPHVVGSENAFFSITFEKFFVFF